MAHTLTDAVIWLGQYDLSSDHNKISLDQSAEPLKATTFGPTTTTHSHVAGLKSASISGSGMLAYGANSIEDALRSRFTLSDAPHTFMARGADVGELAWFLKSLQTEYTPMGGEVGGLHLFNVKSVPSRSPLVRGQLVVAKLARTTSSNSGTPVQLGAVSSAQRLYAALHVFAASGTTPSLTVTVKSDSSVAFASPVTQITFATTSVASSEFKSVAGPITDDWWRVDWTIAGTTPSFTFAVVLGID